MAYLDRLLIHLVIVRCPWKKANINDLNDVIYTNINLGKCANRKYCVLFYENTVLNSNGQQSI